MSSILISVIVTSIPINFARARSVSGSVKMTTSTGSAARESARQSSGPMPAGSPAVITIGFFRF
jgi:hypothetical protein